MTRESAGEGPYTCEKCGLAYAERKWAERCRRWCEEHASCNLEITSHALNKREG